MNRLSILLSTLFVLLFATACSSQDDATAPIDEDSDTQMQTEIESKDAPDAESDGSEEPEGKNKSTGESGKMEEAQNQADMQALMEELNIQEFELEVEYGDDLEYEVEIERHRDGKIEAEVEDQINGIEIDDDLAAFNYLLPYVQKLGISKGMEKQEVIDHVLEVFELDSNYEEFELEIEFNDGTELEIEDERK